jgi:hypothetical protein
MEVSALRFTAVLVVGGPDAILTLAVAGTSEGSILRRDTANRIFCWSEALHEKVSGLFIRSNRGTHFKSLKPLILSTVTPASRFRIAGVTQPLKQRFRRDVKSGHRKLYQCLHSTVSLTPSLVTSPYRRVPGGMLEF